MRTFFFFFFFLPVRLLCGGRSTQLYIINYKFLGTKASVGGQGMKWGQLVRVRVYQWIGNRMAVIVQSCVCVCFCTLEVERSGLAVEALDLSNSIKAFSHWQFIKHADAQGRVHPKSCNYSLTNTKRIIIMIILWWQVDKDTRDAFLNFFLYIYK